MFGFLAIVATSCCVFKCKKSNEVVKLEGNWELIYITGSRIAFGGLYPNNKPTINFNVKENLVSGNNGCNTFTGKLNLDGYKINFTQNPLATTRKMCLNNQGEQVFMKTLEKITNYDISEDAKTLTFIYGEIPMMRFVKIEQ